MRPTWPKAWLARVTILVAIFSATNIGRVVAARCSVVAPVDAPIVEVFREPLCRWCAGKRGIVYAVSPGTTVRAGATGIVWFAGPVGGINYVVVRTVDGVLVTHGQLSEAFVRTGDAVNIGRPVGQTSDRLYFGLRINGRYVDPLRCMAKGKASGPRVILVPAPLHPSASGTP